MKTHFASVLVAVFGLSAHANSAILANYAFTNVDTATVLPGVTAGPFTPAAGIIGGDTLAYNGFSGNATVNTLPAASSQPVRYVRGTAASASISEAMTNGDYFTFTLQPTTGNQLNLQNITIDISANGSGTNGTNNAQFALVSSFNGFTPDAVTLADVIGTAGSVTAPDSAALSYIRYIIDLSGAAYQGLTTTTTFRLYVSNSSTNGVARFDNLIVNGTVIPEPAAAALGLLGAMGGLARRRRPGA